jgi:ankyrin repeat protein
VVIWGDGTVRFQGQSLVLLKGAHTAHISQAAVKDLFEAFRKADFLSAKSRYEAQVTDSPTQTITLTMGGWTKTVVDYVGSEAGMPDAVENLERQIDETAATDRWVKGSEETLPSLQAEGWDFSSGSADNMALYRNAIERHDAALVDVLVAAKAPVTLPDETGMAPLCQASEEGNRELVQRMLGPHRVGKKTDLDHSVLQMCLAEAARSGSVEMVDLWLHLGANPAQKGPGLSAMANALMSGNAAVVRRLLQYPVDVHERVSGETPLLTWAVMGRRSKSKEIGTIVRMLVKAGAGPNERGYMGQTPLFAMFISPQAIRALVAAGARVDARDSDRETPLIYHSFDESDVRELLALGANPALVAGDGDTAAERARRYGCPPCAALLDDAVKRHVRRLPKAAVHPVPKEMLATR